MSESFHEKSLFRFVGFEKISGYLTKAVIINGFLTAVAMSCFIYLFHFGIGFKLLDTLLAVVAIYLILKADRPSSFWTGVFVGLFWFYWIPFSFVYYKIALMTPFAAVAILLLVGAIFWLYNRLSFGSLFLKALLLVFFFDFAEPFGFNWIKPELMLINSYFGSDKLSFALVVAAVYVFMRLPKVFFLLPALLLSFAVAPEKHAPLPPLKLKSLSTEVDRRIKWDKRFVEDVKEYNFRQIDLAASEGYDAVLLPETAFPMALNIQKSTYEELRQKSRKIAIVTGALRYDEKSGNIYNSTFVFEDGNVTVLDKYIGAPFGEVTPLPGFLRDLINELFFNGAKDYETAKEPQSYRMKGVVFRNAICYEATKGQLYENGPKYMTAMSNNGWFTPSIEPALQRLLMRFYSRKYGVSVYHSANFSDSFVER